MYVEEVDNAYFSNRSWLELIVFCVNEIRSPFCSLPSCLHFDFCCHCIELVQNQSCVIAISANC